MNDRRITERILHAKMLLIVLTEQVDYKAYPVARTIEGLLIKNMDDALTGLQPERAEKLVARSSRALGRITAEYRQGQMAQFGLTAFHLLKRLVSMGYVGMESDSAFALALDVILPALDRPDLEEQSQEQARHMFQKLQADDYYQGATWSTA